MPTEPPFFSIVVTTRNPGERLREALESVWAQTDVTLEIIVIDAASTDGTPRTLQEVSDRLGSWISEPDGGVYEAMNKGVRRARGQWLLFLGSDDRLVGDHLLSQVRAWAQKTEAGVMVGEAAFDDGRIYRMSSRVRAALRNFAHHQATFYRKAIFDENSGFDETFRIMGDYELNLRLWKSHVRFKPIPLRISACESGGLSDAGAWIGYREEMRVRHRYYPLWRCLLPDAISVARFARKSILRRFKGRRRPSRSPDSHGFIA